MNKLRNYLLTNLLSWITFDTPLGYLRSWDENKMASEDWLSCYRKPNINLSLRKPENTFWFNKSAVKNFFENVVQVLQKHIFTVNRIYHFDESGISAVYAWSPSWKKSKISGLTGFRRLFLGALFSQMEIQYRLYLYFQGCITKTTLLMMHYSL